MVFKKIVFSLLIFSICMKLLGVIILYHEFASTNNIMVSISKTPTPGILISFELMGLKTESDPDTEISKVFLPACYFFRNLVSSLKEIQTDEVYSDFFASQILTNKKFVFYQTFRI